MADQFTIINEQSIQLISLGHCACGCREKTPIADRTDKTGTKGQPRKYIKGHNSRINHPMWKGGRIITRFGYIMIHVPNHPNANNSGYVFEHIIKCEKALGKILPIGSIPHHINEVRYDNSNSNLVLCNDRYYHSLLHQRMRAYKACGHANWRKCKVCKKYDDPNNLVIYRLNGYSYGYELCAHRECHNKQAREYAYKKCHT